MTAADALNRQIAAMTQFDQRLLTTVYFCLGALLSGFAVLIGYSWFTNYKNYERDKIQLRTELKNDIESRLTNIQKEVREAIAKIESKVLAATQSQVQSEIRSVTRKVTELELLNLESQREEWIREGTLTNALRYAVRIVSLQHESGLTYGLNPALGSIRLIVDKILTDNRLAPDSDDIAHMTAVLNSVEDRNPIVVANIKAQLARLPAREWSR